jgi:hypothetical protein
MQNLQLEMQQAQIVAMWNKLKRYKMTRHKVCIMFLLDNNKNLHVLNKDRKLHVLDKYTKFCIKSLLDNDQKLFMRDKDKNLHILFLPLNPTPWT